SLFACRPLFPPFPPRRSSDLHPELQPPRRYPTEVAGLLVERERLLQRPRHHLAALETIGAHVRRTVTGVCLHMLIGASPSRCYRSEEHTSELQSRENLVCRLL